MIPSSLHLHPKQYYELKEPLKLYLHIDSINQDAFDMISHHLTNRKIPLAILGKKSKNVWRYFLQMPTASVQLRDSEHTNLGCTSFQSYGKYNDKYNNAYERLFLLSIPLGCYLIYDQGKGNLRVFHTSPETDGITEIPEDNHFNGIAFHMSDEAYLELFQRMESYFNEQEEYDMPRNPSSRMYDNLLTPFIRCTAKEHEFEQKSIDITEQIPYIAWEPGISSNGRNQCFILTADTSVTSDNCKLTVGQRIEVFRAKNAREMEFARSADRPDDKYITTGIKGTLENIDTETTDNIRFTLECNFQFDRDQLPQNGFLTLCLNDAQENVRKKVYKRLSAGKTPAKYMYDTFADYSVKGYQSLDDHPGLIDFLRGCMGKKFAPNQMQLEAIVKGILTEDLLLVLGPPGTGKTTVIVSWVEYFVSQGMRVLISSQNNAAVDNVLERVGENEDVEIVRLGHEEKVLDSCKHYVPPRRINLMRQTCLENGQRLETQLDQECRSIKRYIATLRKLLEFKEEATHLQKIKHQAQLSAESLISEIRTLRQTLEESKRNLRGYLIDAARYEIFLEESNRRPFLIRLLQTGLRMHAQKKITRWNRQIDKLRKKITPTEQAYAATVQKLERHLKASASSGIFEQCQQLNDQIRNLQIAIIRGNNKFPPLAPVFESELRYLDLAKEPALDLFSLHDVSLIEAEITRMEKIEIAAEKIRKASRHWVSTSQKDDRNDIFEEILLDVFQVVGATCIGINTNKMFADVDFDVAIIDESGQIQLHNVLVPMSRAARTLMLGDHKQIPPIADENLTESCRLEHLNAIYFEKSYFEILFETLRQNELKRSAKYFRKNGIPGECGEPTPEACVAYAKKQMLLPAAPTYEGTSLEKSYTDADGKTQYLYECRYSREEVEAFIGQITSSPKKTVNLNRQFRMPRNISDVIAEWFYEGNYFSSYNARFEAVVPHTTLPLVIVDTSGLPNRMEQRDHDSYMNLAEADLVVDIVEAVLSSMSEAARSTYLKKLSKHLGIISPYGLQVRLIRQRLKARLDFTDCNASTAVASLDSFQGQERDLIIYSFTRSAHKSPKAARVGFMRELRRLNVAFTRSKKQLVIIGDMDYLQNCQFIDPKDCLAECPCEHTDDAIITQTHISQCDECPKKCERRLSRFLRLLIQRAQEDGASAGNLYRAEEFTKLLKGGNSHAL